MARKYPLILADGEIVEADSSRVASLLFGFPSVTIGGKIVVGDLNMHQLDASTEELVAPVRVQIDTNFVNSLVFMREKAGGAPAKIDTDHEIALLTGDGFAIFDEFDRASKIYYYTDNIANCNIFWSCGYNA